MNKLSKNPILIFGVVSFILFGLVSLGSVPLAKSLSNQGNFSLVALSGIFQDNSKEAYFISSTKKIWSESPEFLLIGNNSFQAASPPTTFSPEVLGALVGGYEIEDTKKVITEYIVESGDNLSSIATKFNISFSTLLWANDLNKYSLIQPGQKLIILPVSGIIYHVKDGDTLSEIAKKYKGKTKKITVFNNLSNEGDIYVGDIIIVPDGEMPPPSTKQYVSQQVPIANSFFICPISSPCQITQGLHWYNAIDFSHGKCGEPIYAAAAGKVLKVKLTNSTSRWTYGGAGNNLTILHLNGVVTMYGHLATSLVSPGQEVSQGQLIALMGGRPGTPGAGLSTGCHLHFGVSGARNPFAR